MSCRDEPFSITLCFENFNSKEEIDNKVDEPTNDEFDEYKNYSSYDGEEGRMERSSFDSLGEERNEKQNEERNKEQSEEGNERRDSHILTKGKCFWQGVDCDLVDSNCLGLCCK
jgi:hypothetical protein